MPSRVGSVHGKMKANFSVIYEGEVSSCFVEHITEVEGRSGTRVHVRMLFTQLETGSGVFFRSGSETFFIASVF